MLNCEEIIFGIASSATPVILYLLSLGFIFEYFRFILFKD